MLRLLGRTTGASTPMASGSHRSQMTLQTPRSFNSWLRSQLKEKKMSQRQLALQSGVDHSTISRLIKGADNSEASKEDSPVRLVFEFEGDKSKLPFSDRAALSFAETVTRRESPYATLMYIWSNRAPVGAVVRNPRTGRVQMVVASSGSAGVGQWQTLARNLRDDYRKAFGEEPGKLLAYGVLTDTDNTGEQVTGWYGDIVFKAAQ